ncbi:MAG: bacillithiol system redox-active protein YtxJ [Bacteroidota bacterium]
MSENWTNLTEVKQIDTIVSLSYNSPVFIFKHSVTCGISAQAKENLEIGTKNGDKLFHFYYLDLLNFRTVSNEIATAFDVHHQSPQIILVHHGKAIFSASHHKIKPTTINESLQLLT